MSLGDTRASSRYGYAISFMYCSLVVCRVFEHRTAPVYHVSPIFR